MIHRHEVDRPTMTAFRTVRDAIDGLEPAQAAGVLTNVLGQMVGNGHVAVESIVESLAAETERYAKLAIRRRAFGN